MKTKHIISLFAAFLLSATGGYAQSVSQIKSNTKEYLYGEGSGATERAADDAALNDLIRKISVTVHGDFTSREREETVGNEFSSETAYESIIKTYSSATLNNTERIIVKQEPNAEVFRYIKRSEIDKIFKSRADKALEFVRLADVALGKTQIDDALRYYYWALCLTRSLRYPNDVKIDVNGVQLMLTTYLPQKIDEVCSDVALYLEKQDEDVYTLYAVYKGKPVRSMDYTFNDGNGYGAIYSARDGEGVVETAPGMIAKQVQVKLEYEFQGIAVSDREVEGVIPTYSDVFKHAYITVPLNGKKEQEPVLAQNIETKPEEVAAAAAPEVAHNTSTESTGKTSAKGSNAKASSKGKNTKTSSKGSNSSRKADNTASEEMKKKIQQLTNAPKIVQQNSLVMADPVEKEKHFKLMQQIITATRTKNLASVRSMFSDQGYSELTKILNYGRYSVNKNQNLQFYSDNTTRNIVCRGMSCMFYFSKNRNFNEQLSFTFQDGKVVHVALGLGKQMAEEEILERGTWGDISRRKIVSFLEDYRTAYAMKDIQYMEDVFDDNAVIIVGNMKVVRAPKLTDMTLTARTVVKTTRYTKRQFLQHLRNSFKGKEYINLHFTDCQVMKLGNAERYGIQLKQEYYSNNYGDNGYLYLLVDLTNPDQPIIHVRTWQEIPDPQFGIIGPGNF